MITNLMRPWLLARLLSGASAAVLCAFALVVAFRVLRHFQVGKTSEGQLALERRAELTATIVQAALFTSLFGAALTVLAADRMSDSVRGAMCAYGVLASAPGGFLSILTSLLAAAACALWLVLHRLDLRLREPRLTRRKFAALFLVAPLVFLDLAVTLRFSLSLDLSVVATCCSAGLDDSPAIVLGAAGSAGRATVYYGAVGAMAAAAASLAWARRRPGVAASVLSTVLSLSAVGAALPAILWYVAPHVYEHPRHLCPFCLLHADVGGIGWPLFAALFAGTVLGCGMGLLESQRGPSGAPEEVHAMQRSVGRWGAISWAVVLVLCLYPVLRFSLVTGGASLFGAS